MDDRTIIFTTVISSAVAVGIMFATFVHNSHSNERQRKYESRERFFYEIYQRRLALYEEVIKTLIVMGKPEADLHKISKQAFCDKVVGDFHTLLTLSNRLFIYGSPGARDVLLESIAQIKEINKELQCGPSVEIEILSGNLNKTPIAYIIDSFILLVNDSLNKFSKSVRDETKTDFVDKRIKDFSGGFSVEEKHQKKLHRKNRGRVNKQVANTCTRIKQPDNLNNINTDDGANGIHP
jgi:hypothetical protein